MSDLRGTHKRAVMKEYTEGYNLGYLKGYARRDHLGGWDARKILDKIRNAKFPISEHLMNELSDLETEESYSSDASASGAPVDSSILMGKGNHKVKLTSVILAKIGACPFLYSDSFFL